MEREQLKQQLSACFKLTASQVKERNGHGYTLHLKANWPINDVNVSSFRVQLVGTDPLTGRDVEEDEILAKFSFDQKSHVTEPLTYHGTFSLRCSAVLYGGEQLEFKRQEIELNYPANMPWIRYKTVTQSGFTLITVKSNCWNRYRGEVWARFDGHDQQISLPSAPDGSLSFYLPTGEEPVLWIPGQSGIIKKG